MNSIISMTIGAIAVGLLSFSFAILGNKKNKPLITVSAVDLSKYVGKWFEVARLPASFQKNCTCTTAEYSINADGSIKVDNKCIDSSSGKLKNSIGKARIVKGTNNASLKVTFFWPFSGDYNIIELDKNYQYALVGTKSRKYCWILSRTKPLDENVKKLLVEKAESLGFNTSNFIWDAGKCK